MICVTDYTISQIADGEKGDPGVGVSRVVPQYYISNKSNELINDDPEYDWEETKPEVPVGKYLWTRQKTTLESGSIIYSDAVCDMTYNGLSSIVDRNSQSIANKVWQNDIQSSINSYDGTVGMAIRSRVSQTEQDIDGIHTSVSDIQSVIGDDETEDTILKRLLTQETTSSGLSTQVSQISTDLGNTTTTANQTADELSWLVQSGTSSSNFTLKDRVAQLVAQYINLNGTITFQGLDSNTQTLVNDASDNASTALSNSQTAVSNASSAVSTANQAKSAVDDLETRADNGEFKGEKGDPGTAGTSVTVSSTQYQSGTSNTTAPTGSWSNNVVNVDAGNYLWTKITFSDGKVSYSVARQGQNGQNGASPTVTGTEISYQLSTSGTTVPTGSWSSTPLAPTTTHYCWTKTVTTYSDNKTATTYSVGGKTGEKGDQGYSVSSAKTQWYLSTSNTKQQGGSWSDTPQAPDPSKYYWKREAVTLSSGSTVYSTPVLDTPYSFIGSWCSANDVTMVDGGKIYTGSITADKITVNSLSAIKANMGTITAGKLQSSDYTKTGSTAFSTTGMLIDLDNKSIRTPNFAVDTNGNVHVTGEITATSLTLGSGVTIPSSKVSGLPDTYFSGQWDDLIGKPNNIMTTDDVSVSESTNATTGVKTQTITVGSNTYTTYTSSNGAYVITNIGIGQGTMDETQSQAYFKVDSDGLLRAKNAIIYGTVYATSGKFSGEITATKMTLGNTSGNYISYNGSALNMNVTSLSIGGTSAATTSDVSAVDTKATNAATNASTALSTANSASSTASSAYSMASTAGQTATNYLKWDSTNGLVVSTSGTSFNNSGYNVQIKGSGIYLRNGTTNMAALTGNKLSFYNPSTYAESAYFGADGLRVDEGRIGDWIISSGLLYQADTVRSDDPAPSGSDTSIPDEDVKISSVVQTASNNVYLTDDGVPIIFGVVRTEHYEDIEWNTVVEYDEHRALFSADRHGKVYCLGLKVMGDMSISGSLTPITSNRNLGSAYVPWKNLYVNTITLQGSMSVATSSSIGTSSTKLGNLYVTNINGSTPITSSNISSYALTSDVWWNMTSSIVPKNSSNSLTLGTSSKQWSNIHASQITVSGQGSFGSVTSSGAGSFDSLSADGNVTTGTKTANTALNVGSSSKSASYYTALRVMNANNNVGLLAHNSSNSSTAGLRHFADSGSSTAKWMVYINTSGTVTTNTGSDARIKNILNVLTYDETLTMLRNVDVYNFTYKSDVDNVINNGMMAQDIRDLLIENNYGYRPYLVIEKTSDGEGGISYDLNEPEEDVTYGLDYSKFTPLLWRGWQYHDEELEKLKATINELQNKINELTGEA